MFWKKRQEEEAGLHDVNMTPLIDVSLVLVVILLLATPLAFESSIAIRRAMASGKRAESSTKVERVEVAILSNDEVRVNQEVVPRASFSNTLRPILERSSLHKVVVSCEDQVSHGTFVTVLDEAKLCGAMQIAVREP